MVLHPVMLCLAAGSMASGVILSRRLRTGHCREMPDPVPRLSLIIPARNEEQNLPRLLASIASQSVRPQEVIVIDDHSTDQTAAIARESGATVIAAPPLPDGWRGKTWACEQGARSAQGELLLFVDSDAWLEPDGLQRLVSMYQGGALSLGPWHDVAAPYEQLSLFFNLTMNLGTIPHGLFGQVLLVDRESYRAVGGHGAVRGCTLENFRLARFFHGCNINIISHPGRGIICFRMYRNGLRDLVNGWTRGFASGAGGTPIGLMLLLVTWIGGLLLPFQAIWFGKPILWCIIYGVVAGQVYWLGRRVGNFRWYAAAAYPIPLLFFFAILARSMLRVGSDVTWKGRVIRAD